MIAIFVTNVKPFRLHLQDPRTLICAQRLLPCRWQYFRNAAQTLPFGCAYTIHNGLWLQTMEPHAHVR